MSGRQQNLSPKADDAWTARLFRSTVAHPWPFLLAGLVVVAALAAGAGRVVKDTSVEAFIPPDHSSVAIRDRAEEIFGLRDPIGIALIADDGLFTPERLQALQSFHDWIQSLDGVRGDRVTSLASESWVSGESDLLRIEHYLDPLPTTLEDARETWARVQKMEPHLGTLVSRDGRGAMIVAELEDQAEADAVYLAATREAARRKDSLDRLGITVHVAGQAAVSGVLSRAIDVDSTRLRPAAVVVILLVLLLSFRRLSSLAGPIVVIAASVLGTLGFMGWFGIPYYAITSALPVVLVAISVADAIHILTRYYELRGQRVDPGVADATVQAMQDMAGPITLTTLTTVVGFAGIALTSIMPPITSFGWLAVLGVSLAWLCSMLVLPAVLAVVKPAPSPAFAPSEEHGEDRIGRWMALFAARVAARPSLSLGAVALLLALALVGASALTIDRSQVDNFHADEPIAVAQKAINDTFAGTSYLDVVVEAEEVDGLLDAARMTKLSELQEFLESQPFVRQSTSIADYLSVLHRALQPDSEHTLPEDDAAIAQLLLVQQSAGDAAELEEEIDGEARFALVRAHLNSEYNSQERAAVEATGHYLRERFNEPGMSGTLSGRVNIDYHWMERLGHSHFRGLLVALLMALCAAAVLFRSVIDGLLALMPVVIAICAIYGVMGAFGVHLEVATSMFAAISVGIGVDYGIHLIAQLRRGVDQDLDLTDAIRRGLPGPIRACFFNALGIALGFSALLISELATLERFGALIAVAAISSFVASLVVIPAGYGLGQKRRGSRRAPSKSARANSARVAPALIVAFAAGTLLAQAARSENERPSAEGLSQLTGQEIAARIAERDTSPHSRRVIEMEMVDRRGKIRRRTALSYRTTAGDEQQKTVIFFTSPSRLEGTAFLSHSVDGRDDRWLYLPAMKRVRRIPASERGDYFLGTDFSYEDVDRELTIRPEDYELRNVGSSSEGGQILVFLEGVPKSSSVAKELGYGRVTAQIDVQTWTPVVVDFEDTNGRPLKTIAATDIEWFPDGRSGKGVWAPRTISCTHHQTKHRTVFTYQELAYPRALPEDVFEPESLARGAR